LKSGGQKLTDGRTTPQGSFQTSEVSAFPGHLHFDLAQLSGITLQEIRLRASNYMDTSKQTPQIDQEALRLPLIGLPTAAGADSGCSPQFQKSGEVQPSFLAGHVPLRYRAAHTPIDVM
jgi:hypothetical protein